jgi:Tol biopolymer transport system component
MLHGFTKIIKNKKIIILSAGFIGLLTLLVSHAATFSVSVEPEQGQTSNNLQIINGDATASNNSYIKFGGDRGQFILYTTNSGTETAQIWRMKTDGSEATRLTNDPDHEIHWARPSPDGTKVLFYKQGKGVGVNDPATNRLWVMNADGSNQHEVLTPGQHNWKHFGHGEWSPDSTKIVQLVGLNNFSNQIAIIDEDGTNPIQLTEKIKIEGQDASAIDPSWPNDNTIVYIRQWNCLVVCGNQDVYKLDIPSRAETRLTNDTDLNFDPYLSPDGKTYVWLRFNCLWCQADLYKADASVIPLVPQVLISDGGVNANGTFSPDGQYFIFSKRESYILETWNAIYRIKLDGTGLTRVSKSNDKSYEEMPGYY